ncbi:MAG: hypothetical protein CO017_03090, partial [Zetaproteobacteria bacterium CG_4_8_14_3_um_filter_59_5]
KLRTLLGGGLRWGQRDDGWKVYLGLGSFYERETLRGTAANAASPRTRLWRGNAYGTLFYAINERVGLQNTVYFQPAWKDTADCRLLENAGMTVNLTEQLDLRPSIEVEKDSRPPAGIKPTDTSYKTGFEYRF